MKISMIVATVALVTTVCQPSHAANFNKDRTRDIHGPLALGAFAVSCCGDSTAIAQFATQPYKGTGVQLQTTVPPPCSTTSA